MTDEELDALVRDAVLAADCMQETGTFETGQGILHDCARANTTLRAQLAEARAERDGLLRAVTDNHIANTRADRAEAALAAQIEADARMIERIVTEARQEVGSIKLSKVDAAVVEMLSGIAKAIRNQPHDRTALDRYREKVLREAYEVVYKWWFGDGNALPQELILALIEKPDAR